MKRTFLALSGLLLLGAFLTACGAYSSSSPVTPPTSGLKKRVFASNSFSSVLQIIDASLDQFSQFTVRAGGAPQQMSLALDASTTLVFNSQINLIQVVANATESLKGNIQLPDHSDSFVALNSTTGFASVRNSSLVEVLDLTNIKLSGSISIPTPNQIVLSHNGQKLLVFSDTLPGSITVVDTATATTNPGGAATTVASGNFDHPVSAVFSADDTKAYILSCGVECGGAAANVSVVDMTTTPPTPGTMQAVPGATVGLLNANSLYVAGNSSALPGSGVLTVVDAGTLAPGAPVAIGDGLHRRMALDNHGHLFIGAKACTQLRCLTIFDTGSQSATVEVDPDPTHNGNGFGDVGGIQPISGRDRLYLAQGGELRIFDTIAPQPLPSVQQIDIVGFVQDVVLVDP